MLVTDIEKPEENSSINIVSQIAEEKGLKVLPEPLIIPVQTAIEKSRGNIQRDIETRLYDNLKSIDWSPEKLREYATHPAILNALDDISNGTEKNQALVNAYAKIGTEEPRIHGTIYKFLAADIARKRSGNENINLLILPQNVKNINCSVIAGTDLAYHFAGRGFYSLGFTGGLYVNNKTLPEGIEKKGSAIYLPTSFSEGLSSEADREMYLKHIFNHELGHLNNGLVDHHDGRECIMNTHKAPEGYLEASRKNKGEPYFCNDCKSKK